MAVNDGNEFDADDRIGVVMGVEKRSEIGSRTSISKTVEPMTIFEKKALIRCNASCIHYHVRDSCTAGHNRAACRLLYSIVRLNAEVSLFSLANPPILIKTRNFKTGASG